MYCIYTVLMDAVSFFTTSCTFLHKFAGIHVMIHVFIFLRGEVFLHWPHICTAALISSLVFQQPERFTQIQIITPTYPKPAYLHRHHQHTSIYPRIINPRDHSLSSNTSNHLQSSWNQTLPFICRTSVPYERARI